ncbi:hypothetical protein Bca52824_010251 [Brassica carinata]|uniref:C2H2-type domain-containing protein n=1 Tax=Brassica carinata TaxID=52824 RepID=A0A8X7WFP2_BRACI|nr:hypothetical protein Bca52824_010251 [Brassica carinata]
MTTNNSDSDPNFHTPLTSTSNAIIPIYPNPNLQLDLSPSYDQSPRKKRTRTVAFPSSSSPKPTPKPKYPRKPDPNTPKSHVHVPNRQWRGINPPPNHRGPTPVSFSNQNQRLPNWVSLMTEEDHEVASYLLMLANSTPSSSSCGERFECGGCKKVFGSHQALGGHRASNKNVKGCFTITNVADDPMTVATTPLTTPSYMFYIIFI